VKTNYSLDDSTKINFLDANGNPIPLDYDSLYDQMMIIAEFEHPTLAGTTQEYVSGTHNHQAMLPQFNTQSFNRGVALALALVLG
jgi:hypothetical protein